MGKLLYLNMLLVPKPADITKNKYTCKKDYVIIGNGNIWCPYDYRWILSFFILPLLHVPDLDKMG
jgi:hypothetical protein